MKHRRPKQKVLNNLLENYMNTAHAVETTQCQAICAELFKIAKYAIELHDMLQELDEDQLEGWVQSKISKASAYMGDVKHHLEYETVVNNDGFDIRAELLGSLTDENVSDEVYADHTNDMSYDTPPVEETPLLPDYTTDPITDLDMGEEYDYELGAGEYDDMDEEYDGIYEARTQEYHMKQILPKMQEAYKSYTRSDK